MGPTLASVVAGIGTLLLLAIFLGKVWRPDQIWRYPGEPAVKKTGESLGAGAVLKAWSPFIALTVSVVIWGLAPVVKILDLVSWKAPVPGLHEMVYRMPPVTLAPVAEKALFDVSWLSTPGTGVVIAGFLIAPLVGLSFRKTWNVFLNCMWKLRLGILAIMAMLGVGYLTRYCGMDATLGMAMSHTGTWFPFWGTMIGWLGVALSGTDAGSNALFGSFQVVTANKLGLSPILMGAANSAGGVMGKMIAAQSLVIACAVTGQDGKEGLLFRKVLIHCLLLGILVGLIVCLFAYVFPGAIPSGHHYL
jgi:lactate permease